MTPLALALNTEPIKYAVLVLLAPYWIPFFRALLRTLNDSLREEGGLFGTTPSAARLARLREAHGDYVNDLVSLPKHGVREESHGAGAAPAVSVSKARASGTRPPRFQALWRNPAEVLHTGAGPFSALSHAEQMRRIQEQRRQPKGPLVSEPRYYPGDVARAQRERYKPKRTGPGTREGRGFQ